VTARPGARHRPFGAAAYARRVRTGPRVVGAPVADAALAGATRARLGEPVDDGSGGG
jgi:hypothetical protein